MVLLAVAGLKLTGSTGALVLGGVGGGWGGGGGGCGVREKVYGSVTPYPRSLDHAMYLCNAERSVWDWTENRGSWSGEWGGFILSHHHHKSGGVWSGKSSMVTMGGK